MQRSHEACRINVLSADRLLVFGARHEGLDADLVRVIRGFDALLVISGSTQSSTL